MKLPMRPLRTSILASALVALALGSPSAPVQGQNVVIDEGTFILYMGDREVGSETFAIRRVGSGGDAKVYANAVVEIDRGELVEMRPILEVGAEGQLESYQIDISGGNGEQVALMAADRRFIARIKSAAGERERELRRASGAVILEEAVAHQYYFLPASLSEGATIPVILPRQGEQVQARVTAVAPATVRVGGDSVDARRVTLTVAGQERQIWFDDDNRVLRVSIPSTGFRAERQGS